MRRTYIHMYIAISDLTLYLFVLYNKSRHDLRFCSFSSICSRLIKYQHIINNKYEFCDYNLYCYVVIFQHFCLCRKRRQLRLSLYLSPFQTTSLLRGLSLLHHPRCLAPRPVIQTERKMKKKKKTRKRMTKRKRTSKSWEVAWCGGARNGKQQITWPKKSLSPALFPSLLPPPLSRHL